MKCSKCDSEMILLFTSYICESCEASKATIVKTKDGPISPSLLASFTGSPLFKAYEKIGGVGFYYDPEYAKKRNCGKVDFQIENGNHSRYVFSKQDIQDLLSYVMGRGKFSICRSGIVFEYDDKLCKLFIATHSFDTSDIEKICQFFKPMVFQAP